MIATQYQYSIVMIPHSDGRTVVHVHRRYVANPLAGLGKARKLHTAIQYMPGDPDGVWSEACDGYGDNVHADLDEVSHLMRLYHARVLEWQASK